jgi:hypothetical protein
MRQELTQCILNPKTKCEGKHFDSIDEFTAYSTDEFLVKECGKRFAEWMGRDLGASANEARTIANEVWQEGLDLFDSAKGRLSARSLPTPRTRRRRARFDEFSGDEVCPDRLRCGAPFWRTTSREHVNGPTTITIVVHTSAPSFRSSSEIGWRGVASVVLCELLESAGYRVEIISYDCGTEAYTDGTTAFNTICLKRCDEPLDVASLVAAMSGWLFRSFGLGALERSWRGAESVYGFGKVTELNAAQFQTLSGIAPGVMIQGVWDEFAAVELIESTMAKLESGELAAV